MDTWFEAASSRFETFLVEKLDTYGKAVCSLNAVLAAGADATLNDSHLRARPTTFEDDAERAVCDAMCDLPSGFGLASEDECGAVSTLYGELSTRGIRQICDALWDRGVVHGVTRSVNDITLAPAGAIPPSSNRKPCHSVVFVDLGSGTGRVTFETLLLLREKRLPSDVAASANVVVDAVGIEFCEARHQAAVKALELLRRDPIAGLAGFIQRPPRLVHGDFLVSGGIPLMDHTPSSAGPKVLAFCCGVGFDIDFCRKICDRLYALQDRLWGAVLLFKEAPLDHPLLSCPILDHRREDGDNEPALPSGFRLERITVSSTWMDETPALLVLPAAHTVAPRRQ